MDQGPFEQLEDGVRIRVRLQPGAKKTQLAGRYGDAIKIKVQARPVEGAANEAAARFIAKELGLSRGKVDLVGGQRSREKVFLARGVSVAEAEERLSAGGE